MIEPTQQEIERAVEVCAALGLGHCTPGKCEECDREREIIAQALADARADGIEAAAEVVDQCNREGPYNAIGAASRIRALIGDGNG